MNTITEMQAKIDLLTEIITDLLDNSHAQMFTDSNGRKRCRYCFAFIGQCISDLCEVVRARNAIAQARREE